MRCSLLWCGEVQVVKSDEWCRFCVVSCCLFACPATRDVDFKIAKNATLRFMRVNEQPPILSSLNPSVFIEQDGVVEGTEAFLCVLAISVSPGQPLQSSDPDTITITILDIDGKHQS